MEIDDLQAQLDLFLDERTKLIAYLNSLGEIPDNITIVGPIDFVKYRIKEAGNNL